MFKRLCLIIPLVVLFVGNITAQELIKGKVIDNEGEPVIGASIHLKSNRSVGTVTDNNGSFKIQVKPGTMLVVSYIGMLTQEVKASQSMVVRMKPNAETLKEVVVTGYQEVKKERMTGSISTIKASEIKNLDYKSMDQILTGTIAGVSALQSGRPGEDAHIQIRGVNSLSGNTEPIWIVDGMPLQGEVPSLSSSGGNLSPDMFQSGIGNISPDDIESITVLKDAAATAIYGARAANGVIVVKTKSGVAGRTNLNVTAHMTVRERPHNNIRMMNSAEKIQFERELYNDMNIYNAGRVGSLLRDADYGVMSHEEAEAKIAELANINTDWFKELYRPAFSTQLSASASGGSNRTQFYSSLNLLSENGIEYNNSYKRARFNTKLNYHITKTLQFNSDLTATYRTGKSSAAGINTLQYALYANPYETADGYDLSYDMTYSRLHPGLIWNTLNVKDEIKNNTNSNRYLEGSLRAGLKWEPVKGLILSSQGIFSASNNTSRTVEGEKTYTNFQHNWLRTLIPELSMEEVKGSLKESSSYANSYTLRNTAEYTLDLNDTHFVNFFAGQEISDRINYVSYNYSPIFDEEHRIIGFPDLPAGTDPKLIAFSRLGNTGKFESKLASFFLSGTYSFKDRYVFNGSVRYDGSDVIGNKNQFTPLWNVSAKWNANNEPFFKSKFFNMLSLRLGYGYTGSIDKNALPFVLMELGRSLEYGGLKIPSSFTYANPNIKWQTKRDFNVGVETSFWNNRIYLNVNFYNNLVYDLLDYRALPLSSGRSNVKENVADVRNRGWEFEGKIDVVRYKDFTFTLRGNMAINDNKITKTYYRGLDDLPNVTAGSATSYFVEGYPVGAWFGYRFAGVDPNSGHTLVYDNEGKKFDMDILQNQALKIKAPRPSYLGKFNSPIIGGFSANVIWKRWIFNMNFEFRTGNKIKSFNTFKGLSSANRFYGDKNRWRSPGDQTDIPLLNYSNHAYQTYMYDVLLESGDYLRNTYCSIGYNLQPSWAKKLKLQYARITLSGSNLFTLTKYKGIDPTLMGSIGYPNTRSVSLSLNLGF